MDSDNEAITVVGAGPAGLAAAITLARAGRRVVVHEAQQEVGHRFGADLQGLENWSTKDDVLDALRADGFTTAFERFACARGTAFDAWDGRHEIHSARPLVCLVERGSRKGSLDAALLEQARRLGAIGSHPLCHFRISIAPKNGCPAQDVPIRCRACATHRVASRG